MSKRTPGLATKAEFELISKIGNRALVMCKERGIRAQKSDIVMDLEACHETTPLDFERLYHFPDFDFLHDIFGINKNLNRDTLKLENCFLPRCSKPSKRVIAKAEGK